MKVGCCVPCSGHPGRNEVIVDKVAPENFRHLNGRLDHGHGSAR